MTTSASFSCIFTFLLLWLAPSLHALAPKAPGEILRRHLDDEKGSTSSQIASTVLLVNENQFADDVIFYQKSTKTRIEGLERLKKFSRQWDEEFQSELGVNVTKGRISTLSPNTALVHWNVSWVPPTALWLEGFGKMMEPNIDLIYVTYNHMAQKESTFSWNSVFKLFADAITTRKLRVPLACIEGNTEVLISDSSKIIRLSENLAYAEDLFRGVLRNRKCAQDLRIFLESGRRLTESYREWDDQVAISLPWQSVPGTGPLDVEAGEEGLIAAVVFGGLVVASLLVFTTVTAPEFIGQSLFGSPNYIVTPEDLGSIY